MPDRRANCAHYAFLANMSYPKSTGTKACRLSLLDREISSLLQVLAVECICR